MTEEATLQNLSSPSGEEIVQDNVGLEGVGVNPVPRSRNWQSFLLSLDAHPFCVTS